MKKSLRDNVGAFTLLMPWIITFAVFWLYPLLYSAYMSLTEYSTLAGTAKYVGMKNYSAVLGDGLFWKALGVTAMFTFVTVPATTVLALLLAVGVNSHLVRFKEFFKVSYFTPSVTSMVVLALIFTNLYAKDGYINIICSMLNLPHPAKGWLLEPGTALWSIMAMDVWIASGYYMVLFLAGMQAIPDDHYEVARLAGAGPMARFFRITLPQLRSTLLFVIVINTIKSFQIFIEIFVMTKGGPMNETTSLVYMIFVNAFEKTDMMGYASALAYILFIILMILSFLQMKLMKVKD